MKYLLAAATGLFSSAATAVTLVAATQDAPQAPPYDYLATVSFTAASYCPDRTLPANGALLPISSHMPLFSLLGNTYGGDGLTSFGLPNIQSRHGPSDEAAENEGHGVEILKACITVEGDYPPRP